MEDKDLIILENVTRVEVIDETGRVYSKRDNKCTKISIQDSGRTVKIFICGPREEV